MFLSIELFLCLLTPSLAGIGSMNERFVRDEQRKYFVATKQKLVGSQAPQYKVDVLNFIDICREGDLERVENILAKASNKRILFGLTSTLSEEENEVDPETSLLSVTTSVLHQSLKALEVNEELLDILFRHLEFIDPNLVDYLGDSLLHVAVKNPFCSPEVVKRLVELHPQWVRSVNYYSLTPLQYLLDQVSESRLSIDTLRHLIEAGAQLDVVDRLGRTPLMVEAKKGLREAVMLLIIKGADISTRDSRSGNSAIHYAAYGGDVEVLRTLVRAGSSPNDVNANGETPLHVAADRGRPEAVVYLLEAGAAARQKTRFGSFPITYATIFSRDFECEPNGGERCRAALPTRENLVQCVRILYEPTFGGHDEDSLSRQIKMLLAEEKHDEL